MAYKSEHVVDLETGAILGAAIYGADLSDVATMEETLEVAEENLEGVWEEGSEEVCRGLRGKEEVKAVVADKGYNKAVVIRRLKEKGYRTYNPERRQKGRRRWRDKGGRETAVALYQNRARVQRKKGKALQRKRGELIERTFAHICETGAARRTRLRGQENVSKRYLLQVAAANLGLVMRHLLGRGTPRGLAETFGCTTQAIMRFTFFLERSMSHWFPLFTRGEGLQVLPLASCPLPYIDDSPSWRRSTGC